MILLIYRTVVGPSVHPAQTRRIGPQLWRLFYSFHPGYHYAPPAAPSKYSVCRAFQQALRDVSRIKLTLYNTIPYVIQYISQKTYEKKKNYRPKKLYSNDYYHSAISGNNFSYQRPVLETSIFIPDEWVFIFMWMECCCLIIILFQILGLIMQSEITFFQHSLTRTSLLLFFIMHGRLISIF